MAKVLVAGVGNVLRGDDGFGVEVARKLIASGNNPRGVQVIEVGIAGIALVQDLLDSYDALIVIDAVSRNGRPGTLYLLEPEVRDMDSYEEEERLDLLADMHYTEPSKALMLAKALAVLPRKVLILGCEPETCDELRVGLSKPVKRAVEQAIKNLNSTIAELLK